VSEHEVHATQQGDPEGEWIAHAREYCSRIEYGSAVNVHVFRRGETAPCLALTRDSNGTVAVVDAVEGQIGIIRTERRFLLPKYAMYRGTTIVWTLAVRSVFRSRHTVEIAGDTTWRVTTPFFSVRLAGDTADGARLLGRVGERTYEWLWLVEPGKDSDAFLSALAFMHRQWYLG
jgi:hypothetical protein